jgi:hypothetical protein
MTPEFKFPTQTSPFNLKVTCPTAHWTFPLDVLPPARPKDNCLPLAAQTRTAGFSMLWELDYLEFEDM